MQLIDPVVTPEQLKKDNIKKGRCIRRNAWKKQSAIDSVNKLPNEFRAGELSYNYSNMYHGDSYCKLYADE